MAQKYDIYPLLMLDAAIAKPPITIFPKKFEYVPGLPKNEVDKLMFHGLGALAMRKFTSPNDDTGEESNEIPPLNWWSIVLHDIGRLNVRAKVTGRLLTDTQKKKNYEAHPDDGWEMFKAGIEHFDGNPYDYSLIMPYIKMHQVLDNARPGYGGGGIKPWNLPPSALEMTLLDRLTATSENYHASKLGIGPVRASRETHNMAETLDILNYEFDRTIFSKEMTEKHPKLEEEVNVMKRMMSNVHNALGGDGDFQPGEYKTALQRALLKFPIMSLCGNGLIKSAGLTIPEVTLQQSYGIREP